MKDIGKITGIYFYLLAVMQILTSFIYFQTVNHINVNLGIVLFLVIGYFLTKHNEKARKIVIVFSVVMIIIQTIIFVYFVLKGIPDGWKIQLWGIPVTGSKTFIVISSFISIFIPTIPFFLLRSKKAREEFK